MTEPALERSTGGVPVTGARTAVDGRPRPPAAAGGPPVGAPPAGVLPAGGLPAEGMPAEGMPAGGRPDRRPAPGLAVLLVRSARPRQWVKNLLVLLAPFAAGVLGRPAVALRGVAAVAVFTVTCSGLYLVNDALDAAEDRQHPRKRLRPVASGALPVAVAVRWGAALIVAGLALAAPLSLGLTAVLGGYTALTLGYGARLKRVPWLELLIVASGFVLRALAGGAATRVPLSGWFVVVIAAGSLFLVTGKRLAEVSTLGPDRAAGHRSVLARYAPTALRLLAASCVAVAVTADAFWAARHGSGLRERGADVATVVVVAAGLARYAVQLRRGAGGAPEEVLLADRALQALGVLFVVLFGIGRLGG